ALAQLAEHLRELPLGLAPLALESPDLALHAAELLLHRSDEALDLLCPLCHLARRSLLLGTTRLGDPLCERIPGPLEHVQRDRLQLVAHPLAVRPEQRDRGDSAEQGSGDQQQQAQDAHGTDPPRKLRTQKPDTGSGRDPRSDRMAGWPSGAPSGTQTWAARLPAWTRNTAVLRSTRRKPGRHEPGRRLCCSTDPGLSFETDTSGLPANRPGPPGALSARPP